LATPSREARRRARIEEQRRTRRRQRRTSAARGPLGVGVAVVLVALIGVGTVAVIGGKGGKGDGDAAAKRLEPLTRSGSKVVSRGPKVVIERTPASYRIVYRVEDRGTHTGYRTDVVTVRRPWESRLESFRGKPPGDAPLSTEVATFAKRASGSAGQEQIVIDLPPAVPASDVRLAPALAPGLASGVLQKREVREVAGRRCQVYRSHDYLSSTVLNPPTTGGYADSCVDEAGLLLEEVLFADGVAIARRVAVEVDEHPDVTDGLFPVAKRSLEASAGGGVVRLMAEGSMPPGDFQVLDTPPEGFVHRGRYSVVPPQAENFDAGNPQREDFQRAEIADVYERGLDVLVLTQGGTLRGAPPFELEPGRRRIDLGRFGTGEVWVSALGNQVRALLGGGHYLIVSGTLAPEELAAVARSLRTIPGGGTLEYADDAGS
jgi:hypothetical protein